MSGRSLFRTGGFQGRGSGPVKPMQVVQPTFGGPGPVGPKPIAVGGASQGPAPAAPGRIPAGSKADCPVCRKGPGSR